MEIFTENGMALLSRWGHIVSGITWIGILYYFNFVQVPAFATFEAPARTEAIRKLATRALWWFRWSAVSTVAFGLLIIAFTDGMRKGAYYKSPGGVAISTGILLALVMFANVWLVIWPAQQVVIASAEKVAAGGEPDPAAAAAGRKGLLASRMNTIFSIPMLWYMAFGSHVFFLEFSTVDNRPVYWLIVLALVVLLELNALGVIAGTAAGPLKQMYETHKNAIISGFVLWAVVYLVWEILFSV